jgi:hypothetical protein
MGKSSVSHPSALRQTALTRNSSKVNAARFVKVSFLGKNNFSYETPLMEGRGKSENDRHVDVFVV